MFSIVRSQIHLRFDQIQLQSIEFERASPAVCPSEAVCPNDFSTVTQLHRQSLFTLLVRSMLVRSIDFNVVHFITGSLTDKASKKSCLLSAFPHTSIGRSFVRSVCCTVLTHHAIRFEPVRRQPRTQARAPWLSVCPRSLSESPGERLSTFVCLLHSAFTSLRCLSVGR